MHDHYGPQSPRPITAQQPSHLLCMTTKVFGHLDQLLQHNGPFIVMHADHKRPQSPRLITAQQLFHLLCMTTKVLSHLDRLQQNRRQPFI